MRLGVVNEQVGGVDSFGRDVLELSTDLVECTLKLDTNSSHSTSHA